MSYKAFVSSTFVDLQEHRACAIAALRSAGFQVDPMEDWTADSDEPKQLSMDRVRGCDLCILLVGARRGHIPEGELLSITQMEYQEAVKQGVDVLTFIYDGESAWPPKYYELDSDEDLKQWRAELMEHGCLGTFDTEATSLNAPVRDALSRWVQKQGWPEIYQVYLDTLRDAHASIRFLGIGHYKDIQDRPIEDMFVDPRTGPQHISADTPPEAWPETSPLIDLVADEKRLVLLGDPGSGKSTLVSWIVWSLARKETNRWKRALDNRTPLVMVLRELSLDSVRCWDDLLAAYLKHPTARLLGRPRYAADIAKLLEEGRAMIMLDGLDEVGNVKVQENLRKAVWEGMGRYEDCAWLLTSRVVGYLGYHEDLNPDEITDGDSLYRGRGKSGSPSAFGAVDNQTSGSIRYAKLRYVAPFTDLQIKKFAQNWFTTRDRSTIRASADSRRLIDAIHNNPYTLRLARTPNLLTMMALIHRERARLPHGRALLYTDIADAYLQSIDENRRIEKLGYSLRDQKQWLGRIGFEMQLRRSRSSGDLTISPDEREQEILAKGKDVRQWVMSAMRDAGRAESNEEAAEAFLDEICRRSGLLLPRGEDQFAFTHLSFQEFFAAVFFVPQFAQPARRAKSKRVPGAGSEDLRTYVEDSVWHETLVFLVELMFAERGPDWLDELLFCLFGDDFSEVVPQQSAPEKEEWEEDDSSESKFNQAILLARLAINPHTGLAESDLKLKAIAHCCAFEAGEQKQKEDSIKQAIQSGETLQQPEIFQELMAAGQDDLLLIWRMFGEALQKAEVSCLASSAVETATQLTHFPKLIALDLADSEIVDCSALSELDTLQMLRLWDTQISTISPLAALNNLQTLDLDNTQVRDVGPLSGLNNLQNLYLSRTQVSDVGPLSGLNNLQNLYLSRTQVSDVGPLSGLNNLQNLSLISTQVRDVGPLSALNNLKILDLSSTQVRDVGPLSGLNNLQHLSLISTQVSDVGPLSALNNLQTLDLSSTQVSDVGPLSALNNLKILDLRSTQASDDSIQNLQKALPTCSIYH